MSFRNRTGTALRDLIESKGDREAADIVVQAIESGKLAPEDFSIKELWEACERWSCKRYSRGCGFWFISPDYWFPD